MTTVAPGKARTIDLLNDPSCVGAAGCRSFAANLHDQLNSGHYNWPVSILELSDFDSYLAEHRTARKRAQRAARRGYDVRPLDRDRYADDIYAINTSLPHRQGRPMSKGYVERQTFGPEIRYPCPSHAIEPWGVFEAGTLWGYTVLYNSGRLCMVSQILGHGDRLEDEIMYLLMVEALRHQGHDLTVFYNRHDSGTDGLRFFKERLGFRPERVAWTCQ